MTSALQYPLQTMEKEALDYEGMGRDDYADDGDDRVQVRDADLLRDTEPPVTRSTMHPAGYTSETLPSHQYTRAPRTPPAPAARMLGEGEVVERRYFVDRVVGSDGPALVAHVRHLELGRRYVLKCLEPEHRAYPDVMARFLRGARAAQRLQSEHSARTIDAGRLESGAPYAVSEFVAGAPLREVLVARGALTVTDAVDYALQAAEALAEAHSGQLYHRSLSLSKLVLAQRPDGSPLIKVLDFGIGDALRTDPLAFEPIRDSRDLSYQLSPLSDTLVASAPEQIRNSGPADARADIWALGSILHELVTGSPVYQADTASALLAMIVADPPTPIRALRTDVPQGLETVVLRCLEKDPAARYPTVAELAVALKPFALPDGKETVDRITRTLGRSAHRLTPRGAMVHVGSPPSSPAGPPALPPASHTEQPRPGRHPGYLPLVLALGGVAIGALIALLAVAVLGERSAQAPPTSQNTTELALQREIVREISALRAARQEESAPQDEPAKAEHEAKPVQMKPLWRGPLGTTPAPPLVAPKSQPPADEPKQSSATASEAEQPIKAASTRGTGEDLFSGLH